MCFRDLEGTTGCFDRPESFLDFLWSILVVSVEHNFAIAGHTVADSLASYRSSIYSSKDPIPGPFQERGSMLGVLREIVGVASPSLPLVGTSSVRSGDGVGPPGYQYGVSSSGLGITLSASSSVLFCPSSSGVASFAPLVTSFFSSWLLFPFLSSFSSFFWCLFSSSGRLWHSSYRLSVSLCFFFGSSCRFSPSGRFGCSSCPLLVIPHLFLAVVCHFFLSASRLLLSLFFCHLRVSSWRLLQSSIWCLLLFFLNCHLLGSSICRHLCFAFCLLLSSSCSFSCASSLFCAFLILSCSSCFLLVLCQSCR